MTGRAEIQIRTLPTGELREKRSDTRVDTIEKQYNIDIGTRRDAHLDTALERHNVDSLHELVEKLK